MPTQRIEQQHQGIEADSRLRPAFVPAAPPSGAHWRYNLSAALIDHTAAREPSMVRKTKVRHVLQLKVEERPALVDSESQRMPRRPFVGAPHVEYRYSTYMGVVYRLLLPWKPDLSIHEDPVS